MVKTFEDFAQAAQKARLKGALSRAIAGAKEDIKVERALKKSSKSKKKLKSQISKLTKQLKYKKILNKSELVVKIPEAPTESVLNDPNRFFKSEYEEEKKLFFR